MARINIGNSGVSVAKRPLYLMGDFTPGDTPSIDRLVENIPATIILDEAWLTFKLTEADADPGVLQLHITSALTAAGQITDTGIDGVGALKFTPTAAQTLFLLTQGLYYDIAVALSDGKNYTIEKGNYYPWWPPLNPWEGSRGNTGLIRVVSQEPVEGQPRRYENELLDDVFAGDDYELRRLVYGLPTGRTVVSATLTAVATPEQLDPGLFQITITSTISQGGKIEDTGSGSPRRADLRFQFSKAQTALAATKKGWRVRVTLDNGKLYTVLRGTMVAKADVTDAEGTGSGAVASVTVTPDPFSVLAGATVQLTAVAKNEDEEVIPGESFTWDSSNDAIATVNASGLVTGVAPGAVIITAAAVSNGIDGEADGTVQSLADLLPQQATLLMVLAPNDGDDQLLIDSKGSFDARFGSTTGSDTNDPTRGLAEKMNRYVGDDYLFVSPALALAGYTIAIVVNRAGDEQGNVLFARVVDEAQNISVGFASGADANKGQLNQGGGGGSVSDTVVPTGLHSIIATKVAGFGQGRVHIDGVPATQGNDFSTSGATNPRFFIGHIGGEALTDTKIGAVALWSAPHVADVAAIHAVLKQAYPGLP